MRKLAKSNNKLVRRRAIKRRPPSTGLKGLMNR
jgi:hypothetical protein